MIYIKSKNKRAVIFIIALLFNISTYLCAQDKVQIDANTYKINYFGLQDVELLDSPFKHAQELDKKYLLNLEADRLLAPFLRESGLVPKAESYTNWENTGLDGHIGGHYLSALSLMYASTKDQEIYDRLNYMLGELKRCQQANANGYIGGVPGGNVIWKEIAEGNIRAGNFDLNGKWVPLYNIHKTYTGLRDAYLFADRDDSKEMLIKLTDWMLDVTKNLSEEQMQDMLRSEHGGLNEVFADVAVITGDKKYLQLAERFSHHHVLQPLLNREDKLTGMHANTQIPKVLGFKRIAEIEQNTPWSDASSYFWDEVVERRSVSIGGNSAFEHFHPVNDFSRMIQGTEGPETCNTYNMLRLSRMLYQTSLDKKYVDYYERALYNHILSSQNPSTGGLVYFTQMRPGHYRVYSQPETSMWCCVGSGIENHAKYGEMIYASGKDELYVNLFIPSKLNWKEKATEIIQINKFPEEEGTSLVINPSKKNTQFTLKVRNPEWVDGKMSVLVNGKPYKIEDPYAEYISINRTWKHGDKVQINLPMSVSVEQMPDQSNYYSFLYGPIVLAAKTNQSDLDGLFADDSRGGHIAKGKTIPMKDAPIVVGRADELSSLLKKESNKPLTFHLGNVYPLEQYSEGLEMIPFYKLHDSRYIIYWPQATKEGVDELQQKIAREEKEQIELNAITIDAILCGQQQPESDHFIKHEDSKTGFWEDIHWREAKSWFGYQLKKHATAPSSLYIKFFDEADARDCEVYINNKYLCSLNVQQGNNESLKTIVVPIPFDIISNEIVNVVFKTKNSRYTPRIVEVRLLKQ